MPCRHRFSLIVVVCAFLALAGIPGFAAALDIDDPDVATVYSPAFADVPDDHVFASSVRAIFAAEITFGCNPPANDQFCPDQPVTRGQMAAFLSRALRLPIGGTTEFTDDDGHVFEDAIERIAAAGITFGCNPPANDQFCPDQPVSRGQMAAFLTRVLDLEVPPAVPGGTRFERSPSEGAATGTRLTVCRDFEMSLLVRSVLGGASGLERVVSWVPSIVEPTTGEVDLKSDVWYLPTGTGCHTLDVIWDPRASILSSPLADLEITSPFGYRQDPTGGGTRLHSGTDFDGETGDPVFAAASGVVVFAGTSGDLGRMIEIKHAGGLNTRYAHLSSISVSFGEQAESGDVIGALGCTGSCTGSHLHFGTFEFGVAVDPMSYLGGG